MSHSMSAETRMKSRLHGAAAVVQDVPGHPCCCGRLRATVGGGCAAARGLPQEPEGGEAKSRPERLQLWIDRPGAVDASEEYRRGDRRRWPPNDRTPTCVSHATTGRATTQSEKT